MLYIAHRGNWNGSQPERENSPDYLQEALNAGYSIEADFWVHKGDLWLGHDEPQYLVPNMWDLTDSRFFCHAKNLDALIYLNNLDAHCFFQDGDDYVVTNQGVIWPHANMPLVSALSHTATVVAVMPEMFKKPIEDIAKCAGICTDEVIKYKELLE